MWTHVVLVYMTAESRESLNSYWASFSFDLGTVETNFTERMDVKKRRRFQQACCWRTAGIQLCHQNENELRGCVAVWTHSVATLTVRGWTGSLTSPDISHQHHAKMKMFQLDQKCWVGLQIWSCCLSVPGGTELQLTCWTRQGDRQEEWSDHFHSVTSWQCALLPLNSKSNSQLKIELFFVVVVVCLKDKSSSRARQTEDTRTPP